MAAIKFLTPIDLGQNEAQNLRLQNLASDPGSPVEGQVWINTTSHKVKWFNGTTAVDPLLRSNHTGTQPWSTISGTPSTLAAYGITDGALSSDVALKAPVASPAFTGTPTAPTAAAGDNTTQVATTAFVRSEVSALVGSAPGAMDTLNELAAALGNDPNFATSISTTLASKAPLNSPAFTGIPTAPTASQHANSTQVATTAYVDAAIAGGASALRYSTDVGNGSATSIVITHNLGTRDVAVSVRETSGSYNAVWVDYAMTTANTVTLNFAAAPATAAYRVTVVA